MKISITLMTFAMICLCGGITKASESKFERCVPDGVDLTNVIVSSRTTSTSTSKRVTVKQRLSQLKARCDKDKLVDGRGKEIRVYNLAGCWGNPPEDYEAILRRQQEELAELKKKFTLIEVPCSQSDIRFIQ